MPVYMAPSATDGNKAFVLWDNILTRSTILAPSDPPSGPRINALDPATWNGWTALAGAALTGDYGSTTTVDAVGIAAHKLATNGCSVLLQYSTDGTTWLDAHPVYAPLTDEDLIIVFANRTGRHFRLLVQNGNAHVGVVFVGKRLIFPHTPIDSYTPLNHARQYTKEFNDSIKGANLGNRVMAAGAETEVDFGFVDRAWVDGPLPPFERHYNQGGMFFYAGYPGGKPLDMGYCRAIDADAIIAVEYIEADKLASLSFGVHSYVG